MKGKYKIIFVIVAVCLTVNIMLLPVSALGVGVIPAIELLEIFGPLLLGTGAYTQSDIDNMTWNEFEMNLQGSITNGSITGSSLSSDTYSWELPDGSVYTGTFFEAIDNFITADGIDYYTKAVPVLDGGLKDYIEHDLRRENVIPTVTGDSYDMKGYSSVLYFKNGNMETWAYGDGEFFNTAYDLNGCTSLLDTKYVVVYRDGKLFYDLYYDSYSYQIDTRSGVDEVKYIGSWTWQDTGEEDTEIALPSEATASAVIGTALGTQVTLEDIQTGEVDVDDVDLDYSKFDTSALIGLFTSLIGAIDNSSVVDTSTDEEIEDTITDTVVDASAVELDILENFQIPNAIATIFPFCIPWDFVRGMQLFSAEPEVPHFEANIVVPAFLNVPEQKWDFVIDLKEFEPVAKVSRWLSMISFSYMLIMLTSKIVKSGGS